MKVASIEDLIHPISVEAYHLLYENGLVEEKAELIEGVIYTKMPKNPIHSEILRRIMKFFYSLGSDEFLISTENPVTLNNSEPEPDIAILPPGDYSKSHPNSALLVLEVSNTSLSLDRKKAYTYAKGKIPEYVIVNLIDEKLEIYKHPKEGIYTEIRILSKEEVFLSQSVSNLSFSLSQFL
jgi:Uma2 family endonuclease